MVRAVSAGQCRLAQSTVANGKVRPCPTFPLSRATRRIVFDPLNEIQLKQKTIEQAVGAGALTIAGSRDAFTTERPSPPRAAATDAMTCSRFVFGALLAATISCSGGTPSPPSSPSHATPAPRALPPSEADDGEPAAAAPSPLDVLPSEARSLLDVPFTGDFDEMVKRRLIRAGVVYNRTQYFIDRGVQRGISYESIQLFEEQLNNRLKTGPLKVHVAIIPLPRDQLFSALQNGLVDFVAAAITITPERRKLAAFSSPTRTGVREVAVTAPTAAPLATADDLSGREVFVRRSSTYYESLQRLNGSLARRGKPPAIVKEAPEALEDDDVLEMVNAGLVDVTIVDDFVADFWRQVFTNVRVHEDVTVRRDGEIAVAVRKNNPKLLRAANVWITE